MASHSLVPSGIGGRLVDIPGTSHLREGERASLSSHSQDSVLLGGEGMVTGF